MRNVFDQYSQPENKLTHALVTALHSDPKLLRPFLRNVAEISGRIPRQLRVTEQSLPGEIPVDREDESATGLPDACIYDEEEDWAVVIECKVSSKLTRNQLDRHLRTMRSRGFTQLSLLTITVGEAGIKLPENGTAKRWSQIYSWLRKEAASDWAARVAEFMESAEARWSDEGYLKEGTLTEFTGYPFGPELQVTYREAKRVQGLAMDEFRKMKSLEKEIHANLSGAGRSAITGTKTDSVWDYIPLKVAGAGRDTGSVLKRAHLRILAPTRSRYCGPVSAPPFHATLETRAGASVTSARKAIAMALAVRMPKSKMKLI
jgi:hypothetical protein